MVIDIDLVRLAIIFIPGLIWAQIDARYVASAKPSRSEFIIRAFIFGIVSYAAVFLIYTVLGMSFSNFGIDDSNQAILILNELVDEILVSIPASLVLAFSWVYMSKYKLFAQILISAKATKKYGDEDVWEYMFNSPQPETEYVHVRDFDKGVTYTGWVIAFSGTDKLRELLLRDVIIYDGSGGKAAEAPLLYLGRDGSDVHIEFPFRRPGGFRGTGAIQWLKRAKRPLVRFLRAMGMSSEAD